LGTTAFGTVCQSGGVHEVDICGSVNGGAAGICSCGTLMLNCGGGAELLFNMAPKDWFHAFWEARIRWLASWIRAISACCWARAGSNAGAGGALGSPIGCQIGGGL